MSFSFKGAILPQILSAASNDISEENIWRKRKHLEDEREFKENISEREVQRDLTIGKWKYYENIDTNIISSEGALYVILPYDYPPTFWEHTGPR